MSLSTMKENGYVTVAKDREDPAVKLYYELHGDGPEHVVLIMGMYKTKKLCIVFTISRF
jgi:hypothetical protein